MVPLLMADGAADHFGFSGEEIALCCGSHNSKKGHPETLRAMLAKAAVAESQPVCGPHAPLLATRGRWHAPARFSKSPVINARGEDVGRLVVEG